MKLPAHNRYDYVPIHKRPQYEWPGGARLAVTFNNNIEYFAFGAGLGSDSTGASAAQSQRNYAWRDYGNRVGIWHYLDLLDEFALPGAHNVIQPFSTPVRTSSSDSGGGVTNLSAMAGPMPNIRTRYGRKTRRG